MGALVLLSNLLALPPLSLSVRPSLRVSLASVQLTLPGRFLSLSLRSSPLSAPFLPPSLPCADTSQGEDTASPGPAPALRHSEGSREW